MRRFLLAAALILGGCATTPQPQPQPVAPAQPPPRPVAGLVGLTAGELVQRLGAPALQVREGAGLKLQFRRPSCVLDAYLYASGAGTVERVTHVDARLPSGSDTDPRGCMAAFGVS
jgi:hypothetical protein